MPGRLHHDLAAGQRIPAAGRRRADREPVHRLRAAGWSSAMHRRGPDRRAACAGWHPPPTPRPHTPTEAPARSDQLILGREVIGDVGGAGAGRAARPTSAGPTRREPAARPLQDSRSAGGPPGSAASAGARPGTRRPRPRTRRAWGRARGRRGPRSGRPDSGRPSGSRPPKIVSSSTRARNGARTRSMKQHLSHSPHQRSSRRGRVDGEGPVAAVERAVVLGRCAAKRSATHSSV